MLGRLLEATGINAALAELRFAVRATLRTPGFSLMVMLTLALGIGATTALFDVLRTVVLQPLPFAQPQQLINIGHLNAERGPVFGGFSSQDFDDLSAQVKTLAATAAWLYMPEQTTANATLPSGPEQLEGAWVSRDFFSTLGMPALLGRTFSAEENQPGRDRVAVISQATWEKFFSADKNLAGRMLTINGEPYSIIGVMPENFGFPARRVQIWLPVSLIDDSAIPHQRFVRWLDVIARIKADVTPDAARADIDTVLARLEHDYHDSNEGWGRSSVVGLQQAVVGNTRSPLLLSVLAAALVLATACVNVAGGLLARGTSRRKELAVRAALGARRGQLVRQLLLEAVLLAGGGSLLGLALAVALLRACASSTAALLPRSFDAHVDPWMFACAAALCAAVALGCGLLPALRATSAVSLNVRDGDGARPGGALRTGLVFVQVGLVSVLLYAALLTFMSLHRLASVDPGVDTAHVLSFNVKLLGKRYEGAAQRAQARDAILERVRAIPGIEAAAMAKTFPLGATGERYGFTLADRAQTSVSPQSGALIVSSGYFRTLGIELLRGRDLSPSIPAGRHEIVINRTLAHQYWPDQDAVGQRLMLDKDAYEVVGVVGDVRHGKLWQDPGSAVYVSMSQFDRSSMTVLVRTSVPAAAMFNSLRETVHAVDANLPLANMTAVRDALDGVLVQPRLLSLLLAAFAAVATAISALGIFSVLAYLVGRRQRELAVRMALGARAGQMLRSVMQRGILLGLSGAVLGLVGAVLAALLLRGLLFGVAALEWRALAGVLAGVVAVCAAASYFPARRAARVDPNVVLRQQ